MGVPDSGRRDPTRPAPAGIRRPVRGRVRSRASGRRVGRLLAAVAAIEVVTATAALAADIPGGGSRPAAAGISAGGSTSSAGRDGRRPEPPPSVAPVAARAAVLPAARGPSGGPVPVRTFSAGPPGGRRVPAAAPVRRAAAAHPSATSAAPSGPVSCQTDLSLAAAPASAYDFLCSQDGTPLTWGASRISVYESGLTAPQSVAFAAALAQWSAAAGFQVTYASSATDAQLTVTDASLVSPTSGFTEDGYTTVSYRCAPRCVYYSARMELSSTATLTRTDWLSTILHELGHVAGLNHVSETGEVMYPYLTIASPVAYQPGDLAGLAVLASERGD